MRRTRLTAVVAEAVALLVLAGCDGPRREQAAGPATTTTTAATSTTAATTTAAPTSAAEPVATCEPFASHEEHTSPPAAAPREEMALLVNVQVQASACVDEIAFTFRDRAPGFTIGYRDTHGGAAQLVATFQGASGVDRSDGSAHRIYDGPTTMRPPAPTEVAEVRQLSDAGGVLSWGAEVPQRRPFGAVVREDRGGDDVIGTQVVIRFAAPAARETRCRAEGGGFTVGYPEIWFTELSDRWACQDFHPEPFVIYPATNDIRASVVVQRADVDAAAYVRRIDEGAGGSRVTKSKSSVAGREATIVDVVEDGEALLPAGFTYRMYVVEAGAQALLIMGLGVAPSEEARHRADVDAFAAAVRAA